MPKNLSLTFLGTCSGGGPISSRNCSSIALNIDGELWLIDCAEGTQMQLNKAGLRIARIAKVFVTHLHIDHCIGLVPLISSLMYDVSPATSTSRRLDIYGPSGLRILVRMTLKLTCSELHGKYAVHELLSSGTIPSCGCENDELHTNEIPGRDILCGEDGKWLAIEREARGISIDAGPLVHRVPCVGYVFTEPPRAEPLSQEGHIEPITRNHAALVSAGHRNPRALLGKLLGTRIPIDLPDGTTLHPPPLSIAGRKIVVLGDTSDSNGIVDLAEDASLLVHEATNAYVRPPGEHRTLEDMSPDEKRRVKEKAISRGHSTADMAGAFARKIRARRLILNHFSAKYPDPIPLVVETDPMYERVAKIHLAQTRAIQAIEDQASGAWGDGRRAIAARDLLTVEIGSHEIE